ncbi:hypothetical protein ACZ90_01465 [Streptomyces albus subsp. albus]|nr:hypothetical protein ACZ90_01465 [Streptomyces albus subsp. albus]
MVDPAEDEGEPHQQQHPRHRGGHPYMVDPAGAGGLPDQSVGGDVQRQKDQIVQEGGADEPHQHPEGIVAAQQPDARVSGECEGGEQQGQLEGSRGEIAPVAPWSGLGRQAEPARHAAATAASAARVPGTHTAPRSPRAPRS